MFSHTGPTVLGLVRAPGFDLLPRGRTGTPPVKPCPSWDRARLPSSSSYSVQNVPLPLFKLPETQVWGRAPGGSLALKGTLLFLQEMASDELRELRNAMTQEAIREHQMAKTGGTTTDLFQCSKCRKKNCTYNQAWRGAGTGRS